MIRPDCRDAVFVSTGGGSGTPRLAARRLAGPARQLPNAARVILARLDLGSVTINPLPTRDPASRPCRRAACRCRETWHLLNYLTQTLSATTPPTTPTLPGASKRAFCRLCTTEARLAHMTSENRCRRANGCGMAGQPTGAQTGLNIADSRTTRWGFLSCDSQTMTLQTKRTNHGCRWLRSAYSSKRRTKTNHRCLVDHGMYR